MKVLEDHGIQNRVNTSLATFRSTVELARENNTPLPQEAFTHQAERNGQMCRAGFIENSMEQNSRASELAAQSLGHL